MIESEYGFSLSEIIRYGHGYLLNCLFGPVPQENTETLLEWTMKELHDAVLLEQHECAVVDAEMKALQDQVNAKWAVRQEIAKQYTERADDLRERIREITLSAGKSFKNGYGDVDFRKGSKRRSWNLDGLDAVCTADEYIKTRIWLLRRETSVDPSVSINLRM